VSALIIDGKMVANQLKEESLMKVEQLKNTGFQPGLAVILVGDDPASHVYVRNKEKACMALGIFSQVLRLPQETSQDDLILRIKEFNQDTRIHGILVQKPLPKQIDEKKIIDTIAPQKDVDGFHPMNMGNLLIGDHGFVPCTPAGVIEMLKAYNIQIAGKRVVVIGRSNIVGKPMAALLIQEHATVTICHSQTQRLQEISKEADIVIAAIGKAQYVNSDFIKNGAVVVDVGMNRLANGKLVGDVDFESVKNIASYITPVPGGVGPMTIAMLMKNTIEAASQVLHS
jgi:methylenetetrahydrofolate dehydrogenase (NADP+)/methenyltetrahydrofolate cyclohydrolase